MCRCGSYDGSCGCKDNKKDNFGLPTTDDYHRPWYKSQLMMLFIIILLATAFGYWVVKNNK